MMLKSQKTIYSADFVIKIRGKKLHFVKNRATGIIDSEIKTSDFMMILDILERPDDPRFKGLLEQLRTIHRMST